MDGLLYIWYSEEGTAWAGTQLAQAQGRIQESALGGHIPPSSPSPPLHVLRFFDRSCTGIFCSVTIATTGAIFSLQFTKNRLAAGLHPDPLGELERSPDPLAAKQGAYF